MKFTTLICVQTYSNCTNFVEKNDFNDKINRVKSFKIVLSGYQYVFSCFHEKMGLNYQYFSIKKKG